MLSAIEVRSAVAAALAVQYPALTYLDVRPSSGGRGLDVLVGIKSPQDAVSQYRWVFSFRSLYGATADEACARLLASVIPSARLAGVLAPGPDPVRA